MLTKIIEKMFTKYTMGNIKIASFTLKYGTILMIGLLVIFFQSQSKMFLSAENIINMFIASAVLIIMTSSLTIIFSAGGFDLSLGSIGSLSGVLLAALIIWLDLPVWLAVLIPLIAGFFIGWLNGILVVHLGIEPVLATLGMSFILRGVHLTLGKGNSIHNFMINPWTEENAMGIIDDSFRFLGIGYIGPIPIIIIISLGAALIVHIFLQYTKWGRYFFIIGGNREAAFLSGVNVKTMRKLSFAIGGIIAAFGGLIITARIGSGQLYSAEPYVLMALLALFVGFTFLGAGKANMPGSVIGALFATLMVNGLTMIGVHPYTVDIYRGIALVIAVSIQCYQSLKTKELR